MRTEVVVEGEPQTMIAAVLFRRALDAYLRSDRHLEGFAVPTLSESTVRWHNGHVYVVLRRASVLAVYQVTTAGALSRRREWPPEVDDSQVT